LCYLDKPEIDALLAAPDRTTEQGRRDHSVLLFLYNTGARASEAAAVAIRDLDVRSDGSGSERLVGKGGKTRHCPLWPTTMTLLRALSSGRSPDEPVFRNRRRAPITRVVVHATGLDEMGQIRPGCSCDLSLPSLQAHTDQSTSSGDCHP
jgi:integrase